MIVETYTANLGMRILYAAMLVLYLIGVVIQMRFLGNLRTLKREPLHLRLAAGGDGQAYRGIPALVRADAPPLRALALVVVLNFMAGGLQRPLLGDLRHRALGLTAAQWGLILLIESVITMALFLPAGLLVDRWGRTASLIAALALFCIASPLFVLLHGFAAILFVRRRAVQRVGRVPAIFDRLEARRPRVIEHEPADEPLADPDDLLDRPPAPAWRRSRRSAPRACRPARRSAGARPAAPRGRGSDRSGWALPVGVALDTASAS